MENTLNGYDTLFPRTDSDEKKSTYTVTMLWNQDATSGNITLADNHSFNEFDTIRFIYSETSGDWIQDYEVSVMAINEAISTGHTMGIYGYANYTIDLENFSQNGFSIRYVDRYVLKKVYGIKY